MSRFIIILILICSVQAFAGQQPKSDFEYARDELVTELIFRGIDKVSAERVSKSIHPDTVLLFMRLPTTPELNDSSGVPRASAIWRHISKDGTTGSIIATVRKGVLRSESNGDLGEEVWQCDFKTKEIFQIPKTEMIQKK